MKKQIIYLLVVLYSLGLRSQQWKLIWSDEFNGTELDPKHWNIETGNGEGGWGTGQMDWCTDRPENVKVAKGKLKLGITREEINGFHYTAGRINSKNKITARYGRIEARIRIPAGHGIGAAFWMLPQDERFGWWPRSGEIDILETNGHEVHRNYGTVHYMLSEQRKYTGHDIVLPENDLSKEFHVYALEWDEKIMKWYLDDTLYHTFPIAEPIDNRTPFNERFYFILSTGVGSDFSGKKIDDRLLPQSMEVDYLRVYKKINKPELKKVICNAAGTKLELHFSEQVKPEIAADALFLSDGYAGKVVLTENKYRENNVLLLTLSEPLQGAAYRISMKAGAVKSMEGVASDSVGEFAMINTTAKATPIWMDGKVLDDCYTVELSASKNIAAANSFLGVELFLNQEVKPLRIRRDSLRHHKLLLYLDSPVMKGDRVEVRYRNGTIKGEDGAGFAETSINCENALRFKSVLPGMVEAEDYFQQSGVQKEECQDVNGGANLGYIDDKDYFIHEVYVSEAGEYQATIRGAVMNYNAVFSMEIGGRTIKTVLNQTFGWQTWRDTRSESFHLEKGVYQLKCTAERGGYNINWIRFDKKAEE